MSNKSISENQLQNNRKLTILIAEDDPASLYYLAELLENTNTKIVCADNGVNALHCCKNHSEINLVLMDIRMPEMDGYMATKLIRSFCPELPIIAQTVIGVEKGREHFLKHGFNDYIAKPIKSDKLFQIINKHTNQ